MTQSCRYSRFIWHEGNALPNHACPEAKVSNPTTRLTLLWALNPFRGNSNYWQTLQEEAGPMNFYNDTFYYICVNLIVIC